jgi:diguanylate cyclase (GGDEF)-like protein
LDEKTIPADLVRLTSDFVEGDANPCLLLLTGPSMGTVYRLDSKESFIGRSEECTIVLDDDRISRSHAKVIRSDSGEVIVQDLESTNGTFKSGRRISVDVLGEGERFQIGRTSLMRLSLTEETERSFRQLYESSVRDSLTGLHNRGFFDERCKAELSYAERHGSPISLLMLDLDLFKDVNDTCGHLAGDQVLCSVGALLQGAVRAEDIVARYGGEEFAILAPGTDIRRAGQLANRIRSLVDLMVVFWEEKTIHITISVGVACREPGTKGEDQNLVMAADRALYAAKQGGRNRVELAPSG